MLRYLAIEKRRLGNGLTLPQRRVDWEFMAVIRGQVAPIVPGSNESKFMANTLWLFPSGCNHGWRGKLGCICEVVVMHFSTVPGVIERMVGEHGFLSVPLNSAKKHLLVRLANRLKPHYRYPILVSELHAERALMDLSLLLVGNVKESKAPQQVGVGWNRVVDAENWLRQHIGESPSINEAARAVGVSPSQLRRIFRRVRKKSPKQILLNLCLDKAMHLMAKSDAKLEEVAAESGFSSATNFCRAFKSHIGKTPTAWRKEA
jgi:AraC-like DNA-binding protein